MQPRTVGRPTKIETSDESLIRSDNSLALDLVYYMKIETENFPKVNFVFMATFIVRENEKMLLSDILYMGVREMPIPNKGKTVY